MAAVRAADNSVSRRSPHDIEALARADVNIDIAHITGESGLGSALLVAGFESTGLRF